MKIKKSMVIQYRCLMNDDELQSFIAGFGHDPLPPIDMAWRGDDGKRHSVSFTFEQSYVRYPNIQP